MTYTTKDAYSDAYGDALNEFEDTIRTYILDLIRYNCAGQYRDEVTAMMGNDDDLAADFLREALARIDKERQARKPAGPLSYCGGDVSKHGGVK